MRANDVLAGDAGGTGEPITGEASNDDDDDEDDEARDEDEGEEDKDGESRPPDAAAVGDDGTAEWTRNKSSGVAMRATGGDSAVSVSESSPWAAASSASMSPSMSTSKTAAATASGSAGSAAGGLAVVLHCCADGELAAAAGLTANAAPGECVGVPAPYTSAEKLSSSCSGATSDSGANEDWPTAAVVGQPRNCSRATWRANDGDSALVNMGGGAMKSCNTMVSSSSSTGTAALGCGGDVEKLAHGERGDSVREWHCGGCRKGVPLPNWGARAGAKGEAARTSSGSTEGERSPDSPSPGPRGEGEGASESAWGVGGTGARVGCARGAVRFLGEGFRLAARGAP